MFSGRQPQTRQEVNHMAVAFFFDMSQVTADMAAQFSAAVNDRSGGKQPEGGVYHAEGPTEAEGWWAFNVWESEEHFTNFFETFVLPAAEQIGMAPPEYRRLVIAWDTSQVPGGSNA
jgi:hypothetical protein